MRRAQHTAVLPAALGGLGEGSTQQVQQSQESAVSLALTLGTPTLESYSELI